MKRLALLLLAALTLSGCTTMTETFPGYPTDHVWTAVVAVAETPDYLSDDDPAERWFVRTNDVWVDEDAARVEIYRHLDRILHRPGTRPLREHREWRFRVDLTEDPDPTVTFTSRGFEVPAHAQDEAERFIEDVRSILLGTADEAPVAVEAEPAERATPVDEFPVIDVDSLEPDGQ